MDQSSQKELNSIKNELQRIINELNDISRGIRCGFSNIGEKRAADCVSRAAERYKSAKRKLDNIDTEKVTAEYSAAHSE